MGQPFHCLGVVMSGSVGGGVGWGVGWAVRLAAVVVRVVHPRSSMHNL